MDVEAIIDKIRNAEDVTLKPITDIVALMMSEGPYDGGPENNYTIAERITAEYISENYSTLDEFHILDGGIEWIEAVADKIYKYHKASDHLDFNTVRDSISSKKDITLKIITDLVAYKIFENQDNKDSDMDFISAETFVAEYVSKNFRNREELEKKISKSGKGMKGLSAFALIVYNYFVNKDK